MIELGMPFSDPMADGPAIQAASLRALKSGMNLKGSLEIASQFRKKHAHTPLILMGYYNPIYRYGVELFLKDLTGSWCRWSYHSRPPPKKMQNCVI